MVDDVRYFLGKRFEKEREERFEDVGLGALGLGGGEEGEEEGEVEGRERRLYERLLEGIDEMLEGLELEA